MLWVTCNTVNKFHHGSKEGGVCGGNMLGIKENLQRMGVRVACSKEQQEATICLMVDKL